VTKKKRPGGVAVFSGRGSRAESTGIASVTKKKRPGGVAVFSGRGSRAESTGIGLQAVTCSVRAEEP
jgi:hypothetical protein